MIGPGRLVLVVGPSGAGKDTLINAAREACHDAPGAVFPRRVVTRPSSAAEDHDTLSNAAFDRAATQGAFAVWWSAHGLKYGLPVSIEADIRAGRTVVCNVSRTIVADARAHYANVIVVLVTAPPEVLAARLAARARGSDGSVRDRVGRSPALDNNLKPDVLIENVGTIEPSVQTLVRVISGFEPV